MATRMRRVDGPGGSRVEPASLVLKISCMNSSPRVFSPSSRDGPVHPSTVQSSRLRLRLSPGNTTISHRGVEGVAVAVQSDSPEPDTQHVGASIKLISRL
jgi:hypothetical protein